MRLRAGFTLLEIMVASLMALVVAGALLRVVWFGRGVEREVRSSYLIREDADVVFRQLQEELRLTHLASIRLGDQDNGFAMASPLADNKMTSFELSRYGVAKWKNWVHFATVARDENLGTLVRWETPFPENATLPLPPPSTAISPGDSKWTLLSDVVLPGKGSVTSADGSLELGEVSDGGGLQLRFLRRDGKDESLSTINPALQSDKEDSTWSRGSTPLVDCSLKVADTSTESGKLSLYTLSFRVKPRN